VTAWKGAPAAKAVYADDRTIIAFAPDGHILGTWALYDDTPEFTDRVDPPHQWELTTSHVDGVIVETVNHITVGTSGDVAATQHAPIEEIRGPVASWLG
jgi:hypothetical protein